MSNSTVEVYEKLKSTVGDEGAKILIEYVDSKIEKTAVTKLDLANTENSLRAEIKEVENSLRAEINNVRTEMKEMENNLRTEIKELDHRMRLYFLGVAVLILLTNPKVLDLVGRLLGVIK